MWRISVCQMRAGKAVIAMMNRRMRISFTEITLLVTIAIEGPICDDAMPGAWHGSNAGLQLSDDEGVC
jgi:hypothetical protein